MLAAQHHVWFVMMIISVYLGVSGLGVKHKGKFTIDYDMKSRIETPL